MGSLSRASELLTVATVKTFVFGTVEDATVPGRPERCPWPDANVFLSGRMRALDGGAELGIARACAMVSGALEPGAGVPFYAEFHFEGGDRYRAEGTAHVLTGDLPATDILLACCALRLVAGPDGFLGGVAASASVFNPTRRPGVETGSTWTLHAYFD
jgi:hypothetical protein